MQKIVDINTKEATSDKIGGLTSPSLLRSSSATYLDKYGVLRTSHGTRDQIINTSAQNDLGNANWDLNVRAANSDGNELIANTENNYHGVGLNNLTSAYCSYIFSGEFKQGAVPFVFLRLLSVGDAYFNLSNGTIGTVDNATTYGPIDQGDGWYRCAIIVTATADNQDFYIYAADTGEDRTYEGDNSTPSIYARNMMIEEIPSENTYGPELITNGDFTAWTGDDPDDWIVDAEDGSNYITEHVDGARLVSDASAALYMRQTATTTAGKWYEVSITVSNYVEGDVRFGWDDESNVNLGVTGNGTYKILKLATDTGSTVRLFRDNSGATDLVYSEVSVKEIPDYAVSAPSDYVNSDTIPAETRITEDGLLIEGQGINLIDYSNDFSNWSKGANVTVTSDAAIGPDGTVSASKYNISAASGRSVEAFIGGNAASRTMTFSLWVYSEAATTLTVRFRRDDGISDGAFTSQPVGGTGKWTRYSWTHTYSANSTYQYSPYFFDDSGNTGDMFYFYGAQLEETPYATSYIPTNGAPTVRLTEASDDADLNGYTWTTGSGVSAALADAGTAIIEWKALQDYDAVDTTFRGILKFDDDTSITRFIYFDSTEGKIKAYDGTNNPEQNNIDWSEGDNVISVVRWDENLDPPNGIFGMRNKLNSDWDAGDTPVDTAFDGGFTDDGVTRVAFNNELPIVISRIVIYNDYLTDEDIESEIWTLAGGHGWGKRRFGQRRWKKILSPWHY